LFPADSATHQLAHSRYQTVRDLPID